MSQFCRNCGTPIQNSARFCGTCGTSLLTPAQQLAPTASLSSPLAPVQTYPPPAVPPTVKMDIPPAGTQLCVTQRVHAKKISALAWSPDSTRLASASDDNTVLVWDVHALNGATVIAAFKGHKKSVRAVAWSPDGTRIVTASDDRMVHVWNASSGGLLFTCQGHTDWVRTVSWSPDGSRLASAGDDTWTRIWDANTGTLISNLPHGYAILSLAWSPDGTQIATASVDRTIYIRYVETGGDVMGPIIHSAQVNVVAWSPNGSTLASGTQDGMLHMWDVSNGNGLFHRSHLNAIRTLAWSSDSWGLAANSWDKTAQVWSITNQSVMTYRGHIDEVQAVAWSPDGARLASTSKDGIIHLWSAGPEFVISSEVGEVEEAGEAEEVAEEEQEAGSEEVTRDDDIGRIISSYAGHTGVDVEWRGIGIREEFNNGQMRTELDFRGYAFNLDETLATAWAPDSTCIASIGKGQQWHIWEPDGHLIATYPVPPHDNVRSAGVSWSPDGTRIVATFDYTRPATIAYNDNRAAEEYYSEAYIYDVRSGNLLAQHGGGFLTNLVAHSVAWSPTDTYIAVGHSNGTIHLWSTINGQEVLKLGEGKLFTWGIEKLAWSPDGTCLAAVTGKTVQVWDMKGNRLLFTYQGHTSSVKGVAWSPDSTRIVSVSDDRTAQVWNASTGAVLLTHPGVRFVSWSSDGRRIVCGEPGTYGAQVWDAETGTNMLTYTEQVTDGAWAPNAMWVALRTGDVKIWYVGEPDNLTAAPPQETLFTLYRHGSAVTGVAWSPRGGQVASAGHDKNVHIWQTHNGQQLFTYQTKTGLFAGGIEAVAWSPDGERIAAGSWEKQVHVIPAGEVVGSTPPAVYRGHSDDVLALCWSPDSRVVASASKDCSVHIWDASNSRTCLVYRGHSKAVKCLCWSPDGRFVASGGEDHTVQVWEAGTGRMLITYREHLDTVTALCWSPDSTQLVSGSQDGLVQIWEATTGRALLTYRGHLKGASFAGKVLALAWAPDGTCIASGGQAHAIQVWDASSGDHMFVYGGQDSVQSIAWSPDSRLIASGDAHGFVHVWQAW